MRQVSIGPRGDRLIIFIDGRDLCVLCPRQFSSGGNLAELMLDPGQLDVLAAAINHRDERERFYGRGTDGVLAQHDLAGLHLRARGSWQMQEGRPSSITADCETWQQALEAARMLAAPVAPQEVTSLLSRMHADRRA